MAEKKIVVIGQDTSSCPRRWTETYRAGVAGLTTALLLSTNPRYKITVAANHMPGDYDIEYASPWPGADYLPVSLNVTDAAEWDKNTWPQLRDLAQNHPEAGIHFQNTKRYNRKKDIGSSITEGFADRLSISPWWKTLFSDFQEVPQSELRPGIDNAISFTSALFLSEPSSAMCPKLPPPEFTTLARVQIYSSTGQIVVVQNDPGGTFSISGCDDGPEEAAYIMMRAAGGGTVLGGLSQKGNSESQSDPNLAIRIMKRCVGLCPQLTGGKGIEHLDIVRHAVGLRPMRKGGARIEKENIDGTWVVHNYGHDGAGYQSSYGCSQAAVQFVEEALQDRVTL